MGAKMDEVITPAQMRAIERRALESGAVTGRALMERAGAAVAGVIRARWPSGGRAVVLCGPGNNGGDGYVVARLLAEAGWRVQVLAWGDAGRLSPEAATCRAAFTGRIAAAEGAGARAFAGATLVVDALFGLGLARALPAGVADLLRLASDCPIVAVDILSGLDAGTGRMLGGGEGLAAALTVTFECPKIGHLTAEGLWRSGALEVVPLGLQVEVAQVCAEGPPVRRVVAPGAAALAQIDKRAGAHKYHHGHALVVAGGPGKGGAARLAARAAQRLGTGLVTLACPAAALSENAARPDAILLSVDETGALAEGRLSALVLGPGLGLDARAHAWVAAALRDGRPCVLDADALTQIARDPALRGRLHARCVLTPHGGEFARLCPQLAAALTTATLSRVEAARRAAAELGAVVVLKGADTLIAEPSGAIAVHAAGPDRAAPWLATAGAGDVLAGMIGGLLARGLAPGIAAELAVWLHVESAHEIGPGLIADDLPDALPRVLARLLRG